jgi:hypothetical protein
MLTECRRLRNAAGPEVAPGPVPARPRRGLAPEVYRENGLMATDDADQVTIERVLARPVIADIVADRLHAMIVT